MTENPGAGAEVSAVGRPQWSSRIFPWALLILISGCAVLAAWLNPVEEHSYDAATFHVYRAVLFSDARAQGIFYPGWVQPINAGLGGPLFAFYPPLTYYALDALHALGLPHPLAWRLLVGLAMLVAATGMFVLIREVAGEDAPALAAAALFLYSLPVLRELLERGAPEGFAVALYPWGLWGAARFARSPGGVRFAVAALIWAALILTHHLAAAFLLPALILLALLAVPHAGRRAVGGLALTLSAGAALAAVFLVPFLADRGAVRLDNVLALEYAQVVRNAISLPDLLALPAAYDTGLGNNAIGERLGPLAGAILAAGLLIGLARWLRERRRVWPACAGFALLGLALIWLQTPASDAVWRALPFLAYVQIRTRLLGAVVLCAAVVVGLVLGQMRGRWRSGAAAGVAIAAVALALPVLYPRLQYRYAAFQREPTVADTAAFALRENVPGLTAFNEFLPVWRYLPFTAEEARRVAQSLLAALPEGAQVAAEERGASHMSVQLWSPTPFDAVLHVLYYPGWVAYVDGQGHRLEPAEGTGYAVLPGVPAGTHRITLNYLGTPAQRSGAWMSLLALAGITLTAILWRGRPRVSTPATGRRAHWWLAGGLALLLAIKVAWLDPYTTALRRASTCATVAGPAGGLDVSFGEEIRLCGLELPTRTYRPGARLRVTLYWQADRVVEQPAVSFVHLLGATFNPRTGNPLWGQQDKQLPGEHPVMRWAPGKIYRDTYDFQIDPGTPPGEYQLEVGWFRPETGQRLAPQGTGPGDRVLPSNLESLLVPGIVVRE